MKFYHTKEFRKLQTKWRQILEKSGFEDAEDKHGHLKQPFQRGIGFQNRDLISEFFSRLGYYLANTRLPKRDRKILELYAKGTWIKDICTKVRASDSTVRNTIRKYRKLLSSE